MDFIDKLSYLMEISNLTAHKLERGARLANGCINKWKKGLNKPSVEAIIALAIYFDVSTDYLLGLVDENGTKIKVTNSFNNFNGGHIVIGDNNSIKK